MINLTRAVAVELAPQRIRVNADLPRPASSRRCCTAAARRRWSRCWPRMQPWPEAGQPEHIAGVALFLASDDARFVTGEALVADGGLTAARRRTPLQTLGQGQMAYAAAGVDRGTHRLEPTFANAC